MVDEMPKPPDWTIIKIRPQTRAKYDRAQQVKRLKFVELADLAIDALFRTDPELRKTRGKMPA